MILCQTKNKEQEDRLVFLNRKFLLEVYKTEKSKEDKLKKKKKRKENSSKRYKKFDACKQTSSRFLTHSKENQMLLRTLLDCKVFTNEKKLNRDQVS